jgi:hypothetical protein
MNTSISRISREELLGSLSRPFWGGRLVAGRAKFG